MATPSKKENTVDQASEGAIINPTPKGPTTQIIGFKGRNTIVFMVFGP